MDSWKPDLKLLKNDRNWLQNVPPESEKVAGDVFGKHLHINAKKCQEL